MPSARLRADTAKSDGFLDVPDVSGVVSSSIHLHAKPHRSRYQTIMLERAKESLGEMERRYVQGA